MGTSQLVDSMENLEKWLLLLWCRIKNKVLDTQIQRPEYWLPEEKGGRGRTKWVKGVNCMLMDGNKTLDGEHAEVCMDIFIQCCTHETSVTSTAKRLRV